MGKAQSSLLTVEPIGALFGALCIVLALPSRSAWHRSTAVSSQHVLIWSCCRYRGGEWVQLLEAYLALTTRTKTTKRKSRTWPPPRGRAGGREWSDWLLAAASSGWLLAAASSGWLMRTAPRGWALIRSPLSASAVAHQGSGILSLSFCMLSSQSGDHNFCRHWYASSFQLAKCKAESYEKDHSRSSPTVRKFNWWRYCLE